jgi:hypothetical protein
VVARVVADGPVRVRLHDFVTGEVALEVGPASRLAVGVGLGSGVLGVAGAVVTEYGVLSLPLGMAAGMVIPLAILGAGRPQRGAPR